MTAYRRPGAGRKPVPTTLRLLRGNPGHRPLDEDEPRAAPKLPPPPVELSAAAKKIWRRDGRKLLALGVMTALDGAAFAAYCQSYARWLEVTALLAKSSVLIKTAEGGYQLNPLLRVARETQDQYTRALVEFGMSPSSRTRVKGLPAPEQRDPFEEFIRRGHGRGSAS